MDKKLSFGVEGFDVLDDISDDQLAIVEIYVCHDGDNLHGMPIDLSVIKKAKKTLRNKFLVAGFDGEDFEGHEIDEQIVGFFPESSAMKFVKKDNKTFLVAQAVMSKIYASWAYDVFAKDKDNQRDVSMEITVLETEVDDEDVEHITKFVFNGVTLLGQDRTPACTGASASIIKFSQEDANRVYGSKLKKSTKTKKHFVDNLEKTIVLGKEDNGDMDNKKIEVEENIEVVDEKVQSDEDVLMEEEVHVEEENIEEVCEECEEEHEEHMEEVEEELLTNDAKYNILNASVKDYIGEGYLENFDDKYLYVWLWREQMLYRYIYTLEGTHCEIDKDSQTRVARNGYIVFESEENVQEEVEEEKMEEVEEHEDKEIEILKQENCELKEKLASYEEEEKVKAIEVIIAKVIDVLTPERLAELREEGKEYCLDDLSSFENKVKAEAFEQMQKSVKEKTYSFERMPIVEKKNTSKYGW